MLSPAAVKMRIQPDGDVHMTVAVGTKNVLVGSVEGVCDEVGVSLMMGGATVKVAVGISSEIVAGMVVGVA